MLGMGGAEPQTFALGAGLVTFRVRSESDVEQAKVRVCLAYDNAERVMVMQTAKRREDAQKTLSNT